MKTMQTIIYSTLSISLLFFTEPVAAQSTSVWACEAGQCELRSTSAPSAASSQRSCVSEQKNFFLERIENAASGTKTGSFNFVGSLVDETPGAQTLDTFYAGAKKREYLKDLILTVHAPDTVEGVSVKLLDADGNFLGAQSNVGSDTTVLYWSKDFDPSSASGQKIQFEIQGNAVAQADAAGYLDTPMLWFNVQGTRCHVL